MTAIDPLKYVVDLPENLQERDKFDLYNEMILQLQMARDHLLRQQKKPVSCKLLIAFDVRCEGSRGEFKRNRGLGRDERVLVGYAKKFKIIQKLKINDKNIKVCFVLCFRT